MPRLTNFLALGVVTSISCMSDNVVQPVRHVTVDHVDAIADAAVHVQRVQVKSLADGSGINGSNAVLMRGVAGLTVRVETRALAPNESVDVFWAIFNNPAACTHPNALTGAPCSPLDLFVAETQASLHYAATLAADARGKLSYFASLDVGTAAGCVGAPFPCYTLMHPLGAEVHSALFVPNGGPGRQAAQFFLP
ncbi:MAG: hypothetical protein ACRENH_00505 [Gemmatimonadaceae bacterium]